MGKLSKFFRCFVEGNTISDGRTITAEMIDEIVETFDRDTYTPRINVEHVKGYSPEPPFNGYGDVVAVKAQIDDVTIAGKTEKRKALYAQVDANDQLQALVKADQKPFPSVELTPAYAGVQKVGLIGMAFTDSPASIATQKLSFSRSAPGTFRVHGDDPVALEFDASPSDPENVAGAVAGFFSALTAKFKGGEPEKSKEEQKQPPANDNFDAGAFARDMQTAVAGAISAAITPIAQAQAKQQADFAALTAKLEKTEQPGFSRKPASGADAKMLADC